MRVVHAPHLSVANGWHVIAVVVWHLGATVPPVAVLLITTLCISQELRERSVAWQRQHAEAMQLQADAHSKQVCCYPCLQCLLWCDLAATPGWPAYMNFLTSCLLRNNSGRARQLRLYINPRTCYRLSALRSAFMSCLRSWTEHARKANSRVPKPLHPPRPAPPNPPVALVPMALAHSGPAALGGQLPLLNLTQAMRVGSSSAPRIARILARRLWPKARLPFGSCGLPTRS